MKFHKFQNDISHKMRSIINSIISNNKIDLINGSRCVSVSKCVCVWNKCVSIESTMPRWLLVWLSIRWQKKTSWKKHAFDYNANAKHTIESFNHCESIKRIHTLCDWMIGAMILLHFFFIAPEIMTSMKKAAPSKMLSADSCLRLFWRRNKKKKQTENEKRTHSFERGIINNDNSH